jgi:putative ABC transport system substrate-binding protein
MRLSVFSALAILVTLTGQAVGQDRVFRLGVLTPTNAAFTTVRTVTVPELAKSGFVEGRNLVVDYRGAEGSQDRLPTLARELVQSAPDAIIAIAPPAIRAARAATSAIPIVMSFAGEDPVAAGWVASLARPGGNVTGLVMLGPELDGKRLQLLHEAVPDRRQVAVLVELGRHEPNLREMQAVAQALHLELVVVPVPAASDYTEAIESARALAGAIAVPSSTVFFRDAAKIAALATGAGLPTVCEWREMAHSGCLLGLGASLTDLRRRTAYYVARIFQGVTPRELPVEQASVFEFAVNLRTAKALGLQLPPALLARADEVIE